MTKETDEEPGNINHINVRRRSGTRKNKTFHSLSLLLSLSPPLSVFPSLIFFYFKNKKKKKRSTNPHFNFTSNTNSNNTIFYYHERLLFYKWEIAVVFNTTAWQANMILATVYLQRS